MPEEKANCTKKFCMVLHPPVQSFEKLAKCPQVTGPREPSGTSNPAANRDNRSCSNRLKITPGIVFYVTVEKTAALHKER